MTPPRRARRIDWPGVASQLAVRIPVESFHPSVRQWADGRRAASRAPWTLAVSGGADSVALALLVWAHWPARRGEGIQLVHFDHALRGVRSRADARFVAALARGLGVPFLAERWNRRSTPVANAGTPGRARRHAVDPRPVSEAAAREARFAFFGRTMEAVGSRALWLGHHQDDVAESMLMRLARGSGASGLCAPRAVHEVNGRVHLRPLLPWRKDEIVEALLAAGGRWCQDETNTQNVYLRNRIRRSVLPAWRKACAPREALAGAALSRELLEEDDAALECWLDELRPIRGRTLDLRALAEKPRALFRRALQRWRLMVGPLAGDLSRQGFEALLAAAQAGRPTRLSVGRGFAVIRDFRLKFEPLVSKGSTAAVRHRTPGISKSVSKV